MGFMDKFKDMAGQAQEAAKAAGDSVASMGGAGGAQAEAERVNRIAQNGVQTPAVLNSMSETGNKDPLSGGVEYLLEVEVRPADGRAYSAQFKQQLLPQTIDGYREKVGAEIVVNVDRDDPGSMLLWG